MSFSAFVACLSAVFLCAGAACGCAACVLCGAALRKPYIKARFAVFCVLLSVAVAVFAVLLIFVQQRAFFAAVLQLSYIVFFLSLVIVALLCAVCWKTIFPLVILCYIVLSAITGISLYSLFGSQNDTFAVSVQADGLLVDGVLYSVPAQNTLSFDVYTLPPQLLLPLPRAWYVLSGSPLQLESAVHEKYGKLGTFSSVAERYLHWCLSSCSTATVPLEPEIVFPALYTCSLERSWERISFSLRRDL